MNGCTGELVLPRSEHVHGDADRASAATSTNVRQRLHGLPACRIPVRQKYDSTSCYIAYRHYLPPLSQRSITYFPRFYCYPSFSSPLFVHPSFPCPREGGNHVRLKREVQPGIRNDFGAFQISIFVHPHVVLRLTFCGKAICIAAK